MTTSPTRSSRFDGSDRDALPPGKFAYFRERQRNRLHEVVLREFLRSKLTKAELARRMGKKPEQVTRWLAAPGNWTLDTVSDLLLAISAGELAIDVSYPFERSERGRARKRVGVVGRPADGRTGRKAA